MGKAFSLAAKPLGLFRGPANACPRSSRDKGMTAMALNAGTPGDKCKFARIADNGKPPLGKVDRLLKPPISGVTAGPGNSTTVIRSSGTLPTITIPAIIFR